LILHARLLGEAEPSSILLARGRVAAVGPAAEEEARAIGATVFDAGGGLALPGFHDAHVHVMSGGESLEQLSLDGLGSLAEVVAAVGRYAREHPERAWITGRGWSYDIVPPGQLPDRHALDSAVPDRPVLLESYDGHAVWVNGLALEKAGVGPATPDPPDGTIVREPGSNTPSGVLLEGAETLARRAIPPTTRAERLRRLETALSHCSRLGITGLDDFERDPEVFDLYAELEREGRLPLRVRVSLPLEGDLDAWARLRDAYRSPRLEFGYLKGFVDGVIESKTAWMLAPYAGGGSERGRPLWEPERLFARVEEAQRRGFPVALHAIGDGAVRLSLEAFERAQRAAPRPGLHHRIEHIEVIDPADLPRFAALGVVASMQPFHANPFGDDPDSGVWSQNLGASRLARSFAWRSLHDAGAPLVFGSDWPVMSADPLQGLAVALTRRDAEGRPAGGWHAEQTLDLADALSAYAGLEGPGGLPRGGAGRLRPGLQGDVVVLQPGIDPGRPADLWRGPRVRFVFVAGEARFDAGADQQRMDRPPR